MRRNGEIDMKRITAALAILLVLAAGTAFAADNEINIALWKLPLNLPAMAALKDNTYEKAFAGDMKVNYVQLPSGPKQIQALAAGRLDISEGLGAAATLVGAANGADIVIIGANSRAPRAFAIVTQVGAINSVSDLKGKKVAGIKGSVVYQLMSKKLAEAGLTEKDIEFVPMKLPVATSALITGQVDAALLVGTEIIRAQKAGCKVLTDGRGVLEGLSLVVARGGFVREHPEAVAKYLETRGAIERDMETNRTKYVELAAEETGLSKDEASGLVSWFNFDSEITDGDIEELESTARYLTEKKMVKGEPEPHKLIYRNKAR